MVHVNQIGFDFDVLGAPPEMQVLHPAVVQSFQEPQVMEPYSSVRCQHRKVI
jgi:hypothetical protein